MTTVGSTPSILPGDPPAQGRLLGFPSEQFWSTPLNELLVDVQSSSAGLTDDEAARRLIVDGPCTGFGGEQARPFPEGASLR